MNEMKVHQPQYFKKFQCTGSECKSNCCGHNWQIRIDKKTYDKYMQLDENQKKKILEKTKVYTEDPFLAVMIMDSKGDCQLLNDKGLCSIQLEYGYTYLCRTCMLHPRNIVLVDREFEIYLELSCEEAVRVILFEQNPMSLEEAILEPDGNGDYIPNNMLAADKYTSAADFTKVFWKLRRASVVIMQYRNYSVRVRMLILCMLIEQIMKLRTDGKDYDVARSADKFLDQLYAGAYDDLVEQMPDGIDSDFNVVLDILRDIEGKNDKRFNKYFGQALEGFGITRTGNEFPDDFRDNYLKYYKTYFTGKEYIFENYVVNQILSKGFPFNYRSEASDIMKNYADLLAKFDLVEFLLVGLCRHRMKFDKRSIIDCVAAFSRRYDHSIEGFLVM